MKITKKRNPVKKSPVKRKKNVVKKQPTRRKWHGDPRNEPPSAREWMDVTTNEENLQDIPPIPAPALPEALELLSQEALKFHDSLGMIVGLVHNIKNFEFSEPPILVNDKEKDYVSQLNQKISQINGLNVILNQVAEHLKTII